MNIEETQFKEIFHQLQSLAKSESCEVELLLEHGEKLELEYHKNNLKDYSVSETCRAGITLMSEGYSAFCSTENLSSAALVQAFNRAKENLMFVKANKKANPYLRFYPPPATTLSMPNLAVDDPSSLEEKKTIALQLEALPFQKDKRVTSVVYSGYIEAEYSLRLLNSFGQDQYYRKKQYDAYVAPLLKEHESSKMDHTQISTRIFTDINVVNLVENAVARSCSLLGAEPPTSGTYPIVIDKEVTPLLLEMLNSYFSAKEVDRQTSLLQGKLEQLIASELVTIVDDPLDIKGMSARPFDAEGMPSQKLVLVEKGVLKKYLTNKEYAEKMKLPHTAHAKRRGNGDLDIESTNLYLEKGKTPLLQLLQSHPRLIYITRFNGSFHSGFKSTTGDFSLPCEGFLYEQGQKIKALDQFVVSGNIMDALKKIEALGDSYSELSFNSWAPSVLIASLSVAGKTPITT